MDDSTLNELAAVEKEILAKLGLMHAQHQELQSVDYDADATVLRPYLDTWMDWHLWASYWIVLAKQARVQARQEFSAAWRKVLVGTRSINLASELEFHTSYEERKVFYEKRTLQERATLERLDSIVDTVHEFLLSLKAVMAHWDKRRVDTKWELDRMHQLPGSDYRN